MKVFSLPNTSLSKIFGNIPLPHEIETGSTTGLKETKIVQLAHTMDGSEYLLLNVEDETLPDDAIIVTELESGKWYNTYSPGSYGVSEGNFHTKESIVSIVKNMRDKIQDDSFELFNGNKIKTDINSQNTMNKFITVSAPDATINWKVSNEVFVDITIPEMKKILATAVELQSKLWATYIVELV